MTSAASHDRDANAAELTVAMLRDYLDGYAATLERERHDQDLTTGRTMAPVLDEHQVIRRVRAELDRIERTSSRFPAFLVEDELRALARTREERAVLGGRVANSLARENDYGADVAFVHITRCGARARARATRPDRNHPVARSRRRVRPAGILDRDR